MTEQQHQTTLCRQKPARTARRGQINPQLPTGDPIFFQKWIDPARENQ